MSDRRSLLRGLVSLPLIGGGVTLIGRPAQAVPLIQAAALPTLDDPRQRLHYAFAALASAANDLTVGADGWIITAVERWTPLPGPHKNIGSMRRLRAIHYVEEPISETIPQTILVERDRDIALDGYGRDGWA